MTEKNIKSLLVGLVLGFLPQISIIVVLAIFSSTKIGFDGLGIIAMILFCIIIPIVLGINLITYVIIAIKNKYTFFGIFIALLFTVLLSFLIGWTNNARYNIKGKKIVKYLNNKYNEDFIVTSENPQKDYNIISIIGLLFPNPGMIKKEFNYTLKNKINNNFELDIYSKENNDIYKIIDDEYKDKKNGDIFFKKINSIMINNGFYSKDGLKIYQNKLCEIKIDKFQFSKNEDKSINLVFDVFYDFKRSDFSEVIEKLYNVFKEINSSFDGDLILGFYIREIKDKNTHNPSEYKPGLKYSIGILRRVYKISENNFSLNFDCDVVENKDDFEDMIINKQEDLYEIKTLWSKPIEERKSIIDKMFENKENIKYETKIEYAIKYREETLLNELIKNKNILYPKNRKDKFALEIAVEEKNYEFVSRIIKAGSKIDVKDGRRQPIQVALDNYVRDESENNLNIFKILVESGADLNYIDKNNKRSIFLRCKIHNLKKLQEYLSKYNCFERSYDYDGYIKTIPKN